MILTNRITDTMVHSLLFAMFACAGQVEPSDTSTTADTALTQPVDSHAANTGSTADTGLKEVPPPPVDVLFVVDTSCSMLNARPLVADEAPLILPFLKDRDWHIAAVTTEPQGTGTDLIRGDGSVSIIDAQLANPSSILTSIINVDASVNINYAIETILFLLERENSSVMEPLGFRRADAELHIVFIADSDDASRDGVITPNEFKAYLDALDTAIFVHTLVPAKTAVRFIDLNQTFGGATSDIAAYDRFDTFFLEMGMTLDLD